MDREVDAENYKNEIANIVNKVYKWIREYLGRINPIRKPVGRIMTVWEQKYYKILSSDRIIIEIDFGRLLALCNVSHAIGTDLKTIMIAYYFYVLLFLTKISTTTL